MKKAMVNVPFDEEKLGSRTAVYGAEGTVL